MNEVEQTKIVYETLAEAAEICRLHGVKYAVLSPGSRSAPVALSFLRNKDIQHFIIPDERSAAYVALGLAQASKSPVILVCTSGTAALNFAPAVAEAFFANVPLIVLTADRPPEWIAQADNQSIYQQDLYRKHVKVSAQWPVDLHYKDSNWFALRSLNDCLNEAKALPQGPIHINIPLREPLYLNEEIQWKTSKVRLIENVEFIPQIPDSVYSELRNFKKILFVAGQLLPSEKLYLSLEKIENAVIITDVTSNLHKLSSNIKYAEHIIENASETVINDLKPDLIISFGGPLVSKTLKNFLRNCTETPQWHVTPASSAPDTYHKLSKIIRCTHEVFFEQWPQSLDLDKNYAESWQIKHRKTVEVLNEMLSQLTYGEVKIATEIFKQLKGILHLGNSLPIRYGSCFPVFQHVEDIYSNRGTSGIDGSLSTAVGHALANPQIQHTILLGDLSFMYDRNAMWNNYMPSSLKIIVFNNHGGGIFRQLPGAAQQPEREEYFAVHQPLNFEFTAQQHNCEYFFCTEKDDFHKLLSVFYSTKTCAILELEFAEQQSIATVKQLLNKFAV